MVRCTSFPSSASAFSDTDGPSCCRLPLNNGEGEAASLGAPLTPSQHRHYLTLKAKLRHEVAEERGEIPVRSHLELNLKGNPFQGIDAVSIDDAGNLHPVRK
jgi:hypothetical protein